VQNPNVLNPVTGKPVAWKLMPGSQSPPLLAHVSHRAAWPASLLLAPCSRNAAIHCAQQAPQITSLSIPSCAPSLPTLPTCLPTCLPALQATSSHATRGAFATKHLWVTPYHPREMNPAGDYPLHPDPDQNQGIAQWTAKNRGLNGADCVLWYNMGLTHIVRCEVGSLSGRPGLQRVAGLPAWAACLGCLPGLLAA
jgi:hypothetical protein